MNRFRTTSATQERDRLCDSLDQLNQELRVLRDVIDEFREEYAWTARNGLTVQPIEHVIVKRMAKDPCAADWAERLELDRQSVTLGTPRLERSSVMDIVNRLQSTLDTLPLGQVDVVLAALHEVREKVMEAAAMIHGDSFHSTKSAATSGTVTTQGAGQGQLF